MKCLFNFVSPKTSTGVNDDDLLELTRIRRGESKDFIPLLASRLKYINRILEIKISDRDAAVATGLPDGEAGGGPAGGDGNLDSDGAVGGDGSNEEAPLDDDSGSVKKKRKRRSRKKSSTRRVASNKSASAKPRRGAYQKKVKEQPIVLSEAEEEQISADIGSMGITRFEELHWMDFYRCVFRNLL